MDTIASNTEISDTEENVVFSMVEVLRSPKKVSDEDLLVACNYILRRSNQASDFEIARLVKEAILSRSMDEPVVQGFTSSSVSESFLDFCRNSCEISTSEAEQLEFT